MAETDPAKRVREIRAGIFNAVCLRNSISRDRLARYPTDELIRLMKEVSPQFSVEPDKLVIALEEYLSNA